MNEAAAKKRKRLQFHDTLPLMIRLLIWLCLVMVVILMGLPILNVLAVSFSEKTMSEKPGLILFPSPFTPEGYDFIWNNQNLWRPFLITIYVSVAGTLIHIFLSSVAGYVLIHKDLPLRKLLITFVVLTLTVPGELTLISMYEIYRQFRLINTITVLVINGAVGGLSVLLMQNFFLEVPLSLSEASRIDGASELKIFRKVYLPLSVPGIVTIGTLQFIGRWNNITNVVALISDQRKYTLPVVLRMILFEQSGISGTTYVFNNAKMAAVALTALPMVLLYFIAQKFFKTGAFLGAVKE